MKISTSILSVEKNVEETIKKIGKTSTTYIHLDVKDGKFVENKKDYFEYKDALLRARKPLDVHLMVEDAEKYIDKYLELKPLYMTFHLEIGQPIFPLICKIKKHCRVGISIRPGTPVDALRPYLDGVDLVHVMSVEPGEGRQKFIEACGKKIAELRELRKEFNYHYEIAIDGGINNETRHHVKGADILVTGSYVTDAKNYEKQIKNLM